MPKGTRWSAETKKQAVDMYQAGRKYRDITAATGVPQATVIAWLHELGIRPNRLQQGTGGVTVDQVLARLTACEAERGRLELENELLRAELGRVTAKN